MKADRTKIIKGSKIEEFYWSGRMVCYINNKLSENTFDENVALLSDNSECTVKIAKSHLNPNQQADFVHSANVRRNFA